MITNERVLGEAAGVAVRRRRPFLFLICDSKHSALGTQLSAKAKGLSAGSFFNRKSKIKNPKFFVLSSRA
jgi:hypothetical protein